VSRKNQIEAIFRVLCDSPPAVPTNAVHIFAQTIDNTQPVLESAKRIIDESLTSSVILLKTDAHQGYPGFKVWKQKLIELGIADECIIGVDLNADSHNTLTEAQAIIRFAKSHQYSSLIISSPPFHQLRAFMTAVTVALAEAPGLKIYSIPARAQVWTGKVTHSQGMLVASRCKLIKTELLRIVKYDHKGDLISFDEVIGYLNRRDIA
jgi:hypothetical protein